MRGEQNFEGVQQDIKVMKSSRTLSSKFILLDRPFDDLSAFEDSQRKEDDDDDDDDEKDVEGDGDDNEDDDYDDDDDDDDDKHDKSDDDEDPCFPATSA